MTKYSITTVAFVFLAMLALYVGLGLGLVFATYAPTPERKCEGGDIFCDMAVTAYVACHMEFGEYGDKPSPASLDKCLRYYIVDNPFADPGWVKEFDRTDAER